MHYIRYWSYVVCNNIGRNKTVHGVYNIKNKSECVI